MHSYSRIFLELVPECTVILEYSLGLCLNAQLFVPGLSGHLTLVPECTVIPEYSMDYNWLDPYS
jgi:hypothetical protein